MKSGPYREMQLLDELSRSPETTQRELSKRIGVALGLTNLMLRRLAKKGYVKIIGTKRSRIRYLITPQGILEKSRLAYEYIQYSLHLYSGVRRSLREQLLIVAQTGQRRILLFGTGELAEIAFLTIHEMGLELVSVAEEAADRRRFLGFPVQEIYEVPNDSYDRIIVASMQGGDAVTERLVAMGLPRDRIITLPRPGMGQPSSERRGSGKSDPKSQIPVTAHVD